MVEVLQSNGFISLSFNLYRIHNLKMQVPANVRDVFSWDFDYFTYFVFAEVKLTQPVNNVLFLFSRLTKVQKKIQTMTFTNNALVILIFYK